MNLKLSKQEAEQSVAGKFIYCWVVMIETLHWSRTVNSVSLADKRTFVAERHAPPNRLGLPQEPPIIVYSIRMTCTAVRVLLVLMKILSKVQLENVSDLA